MNFLQLAQKVQLECGVSGTLSTTIGQSGSLGRVVNWTNEAWNEIQTEHDDWNWMRSSNLLGAGLSFVPAAGQASTPLGLSAGQLGIDPTKFGKWDLETFRNYSTASGTNNEMFLDEIPYDTWRDSYMLGAQRQVKTRPVVVAIGPNKEVCLGPPPDGNYTVTADYFLAPTQMALDTDTPAGLPGQFHYAIVYKAMILYAGYEAAPEVMSKGQMGWNRMLAELEATNKPTITFAGALC